MLLGTATRGTSPQAHRLVHDCQSRNNEWVSPMTKSALMASTAIGLLLCIAPASAQTKGGEEKAAPSQQREPSAAQKETPAQQGEPKQKAEPKSKGAQGEMK